MRMTPNTRSFSIPCWGLFLGLTLISTDIRKTVAAENFPTSIQGEKLSLNGGETKLGAGHWAEPEKCWRTVGELMKSALPPADASGKRPGVVLVVNLEGRAPWGALKALLMASSALGLTEAKINFGKPGNHVNLALPGADPGSGTVVPFPLVTGETGKAMTENGGRKIEVTAALVLGLVKQQPQATVGVQAAPDLGAERVVECLRLLAEAKAAAVAFLPVKEITAQDAADRKLAKDAVERAFEGGLGGLGK